MGDPTQVSSTRAAFDATADLYAVRIGTEISAEVEAPLDRTLLAEFVELVGDGSPVADLGCGPTPPPESHTPARVPRGRTEYEHPPRGGGWHSNGSVDSLGGTVAARPTEGDGDHHDQGVGAPPATEPGGEREGERR